MIPAYIVRTGRKIHSFKDPPGASFVGAEETVPGGRAALVMPDHLFATTDCIRSFIGAAGDSKSLRLALPVSPLTDYTEPLSELELVPGTIASRGPILLGG